MKTYVNRRSTQATTPRNVFPSRRRCQWPHLITHNSFIVYCRLATWPIATTHGLSMLRTKLRMLDVLSDPMYPLAQHAIALSLAVGAIKLKRSLNERTDTLMNSIDFKTAPLPNRLPPTWLRMVPAIWCSLCSLTWTCWATLPLGDRNTYSWVNSVEWLVEEGSLQIKLLFLQKEYSWENQKIFYQW